MVPSGAVFVLEVCLHLDLFVMYRGFSQYSVVLK